MVVNLESILMDHDELLFVFCFGWVLFWAMASIVYRRKSGKTLFIKIPEDALFSARAMSGRSNRSFFTRLGGASNCLIVFVNKDVLTITPTFPFNLIFLPEIYDLEHTIPLKQIQSVQKKNGLFGAEVEITFLTSKGVLRSIVLRGHSDSLIDALRIR